jgi:hypothetical protein
MRLAKSLNFRPVTRALVLLALAWPGGVRAQSGVIRDPGVIRVEFTACAKAGTRAFSEVSGPEVITVGTNSATPLLARVIDDNCQPVSNARVTFTAVSNAFVPGGTSATAVTDVDGIARMTAGAGTVAGSALFEISASRVVNSPITLKVEAVPGPVDHATIDLPAQIGASAATSGFVLLFDVFHNVATNFVGAVNLTSTDPQAQLPSSLDFGAAEAGFRSFTAVFPTAGTQTVRVRDQSGALLAEKATLVERPAMDVAIIAGDGQAGTVGAAVLADVQVRALVNQVPRANEPLTVSVVGGGRVDPVPVAGCAGQRSGDGTTPAVVCTDAVGVARFRPTLGTVAGSPQRFTISGAGSIPTTAFATALAGPATRLALDAPTLDDTVAGVFHGVVVNAFDDFGNAAPSFAATLHFTSDDARATLPADVPATGATTAFPGGVSFTTAGPRTLTVQAGALVATKAATVAPASPTALEIAAGNGQPVEAGTALASPIVALARDAFGNAVPGATVQWSAIDGGEVAAGTSTADATGRAGVGAVAGPVAGSRASFVARLVDGIIIVDEVVFDVEVVPGPAHSVVVSRLPFAVTAGELLDLAVEVHDVFGNVRPTASGALLVTTTDPAATVPTADFAAASAGRLELAGAIVLRGAGPQQVSVTADGITATVAVAVGAAAPAAVVVVAGADQQVTVGEALPARIVVRVVDAFGNAVVGARTSFTAADDAAVDGDVTTDASGLAGVDVVAGHVAGRRLVTAFCGLLQAEVIVAVAPAPPTRLIVELPVATFVDDAVDLVLRTEDAFGNVAPWDGTVALVSSLPGTVLPPTVLVGAVAGGRVVVEDVRFGSAGRATVRAVDVAGRLAAGDAAVVVGAPVRPVVELVAVAGEGQRGVVGAPYPTGLTVRARDASGAGVPGVVVAFAAEGDGRVSPALVVTDADGLAAAVATASRRAGTDAFVAAVSSARLATRFVLAAEAGPPAVVRATPGAPVAEACGDVAVALVAVDGFGNLAATPVDVALQTTLAGAAAPTVTVDATDLGGAADVASTDVVVRGRGTVRLRSAAAGTATLRDGARRRGRGHGGGRLHARGCVSRGLHRRAWRRRGRRRWGAAADRRHAPRCVRSRARGGPRGQRGRQLRHRVVVGGPRRWQLCLRLPRRRRPLRGRARPARRLRR